jgi:hypothetical protein
MKALDSIRYGIINVDILDIVEIPIFIDQTTKLLFIMIRYKNKTFCDGFQSFLLFEWVTGTNGLKTTRMRTVYQLI